MEFEWIVDETGWCWMMPKIDYNVIEKYNLGTWDLADWTFGTSLMLDIFGYAELNKCARFLWRIENLLRLIKWTLYFSGHSTLSEFFGKIRHLVFNLAWETTMR